jgi:hypothetical protein
MLGHQSFRRVKSSGRADQTSSLSKAESSKHIARLRHSHKGLKPVEHVSLYTGPQRYKQPREDCRSEF